MRIGIDIRCLTGGRRTGVEEYTIRILENIFQIDKENHYLLFLNCLKNKKLNLDWERKYPNVRIRRFRMPNKLLNLSIWYFGWPKIDRLLGNVDAFFFPNLNFISVSSKIRMVAVAHDLSFERYPETFSRKSRIWHYLVNPKKIFHRADAIVAVSDSTKNDLLSIYGIEPSKITSIHSAASGEFREIDRNDKIFLKVKEKYKLPYKFILYLGSVEMRKNVISLIEAYEKVQAKNNELLAKYKLVIAGYPGWKSEQVAKRIDQSSCRGNIIYVGKVKEKYKPYIYNLASLFIYPSFFEGFGFPVLEALACGTPVITSNCSSLPEVVGKAAIIIDPEKPDELRRAIEEVLSNREFAYKMKSEGLKRAQQFAWDKSAKKTLNIILGK